MNTRQLWLDVCLTLLWFGFIQAGISGDLMIAAPDMTAEFTWSGPADAFLLTWLLNGTVAPLRIFVYILVSTNWHFIQASCGSHITTYIFCTISSNFCSLSRQLNLKLKWNPINWSQCTHVLLKNRLKTLSLKKLGPNYKVYLHVVTPIRLLREVTYDHIHHHR